MASKAIVESKMKRLETLLNMANNGASLLRDVQALKVCLSSERVRLLEEIDRLKTALVKAEIRNGKRQLFTSFENVTSKSSADKSTDQPTQPRIKPPSAENGKEQPVENGKEKPAKQQKVKKPQSEAKTKAETPAPERIDVSRLDMRIGIIVEASKHPDADSLYVEKVDCGEGKTRTVISGLAKHIPLEEMQKRVCIFLLNLKPAKMRGILSEAMVMCANKDGVVEIITPPSGCKPGDRVTVAGYSGEPDAVLNPKKKIFEQIAPDLATDNSGKAAYKGVPWTVNGANCTSNLTNSQIK